MSTKIHRKQTEEQLRRKRDNRMTETEQSKLTDFEQGKKSKKIKKSDYYKEGRPTKQTEKDRENIKRILEEIE